MKFPNIYGRKPSAILNGDGKVVETYESRRQARRHRRALATQLGQPIEALRIVANGPQVSDTPNVEAPIPVLREAFDSALAPRWAYSTATRIPGAKPEGWRRGISTASY